MSKFLKMSDFLKLGVPEGFLLLLLLCIKEVAANLIATFLSIWIKIGKTMLLNSFQILVASNRMDFFTHSYYMPAHPGQISAPGQLPAQVLAEAHPGISWPCWQDENQDCFWTWVFDLVAKTLLGVPSCPIKVAKLKSRLLSWVQLPTNAHPRRQQMLVQGPGFLPPTGKTWVQVPTSVSTWGVNQWICLSPFKINENLRKTISTSINAELLQPRNDAHIGDCI